MGGSRIVHSKEATKGSGITQKGRAVERRRGRDEGITEGRYGINCQ